MVAQQLTDIEFILDRVTMLLSHLTQFIVMDHKQLLFQANHAKYQLLL